MKTTLFSLAFMAISASSFTQVTPLKGKLSDGTLVEIVTNKGELGYGNGATVFDTLKIKYFDIRMAHQDIFIVVGTDKNGLITKEDSKTFIECKGDYARLDNIIAYNKKGKRVELPAVEFVIQ